MPEKTVINFEYGQRVHERRDGKVLPRIGIVVGSVVRNGRMFCTVQPEGNVRTVILPADSLLPATNADGGLLEKARAMIAGRRIEHYEHARLAAARRERR